jgi:phosphoribosyl-ATP pyrophosphohydrolase/phosphoribosyl-AMP cyclohydrolase
MIVPSIDIMGGKAVQLRRGREKILERDDTLALTRDFGRFGEVAVIDLDAALEGRPNTDLIRQLAAAAECRIGGGIRTLQRAEEVLRMGAARIIIGSAVFQRNEASHGRATPDTSFLEALVRAVGRDRIVIALDSREGQVVSQGWTQHTGWAVEELLTSLESYCTEYLVTFVEKEGMMAGLPLERAAALAGLTRNRLTAAGGIARVEEVETLAGLHIDAQVGMALYLGAIDPVEAFVCCLDWSGGLLPTVVEDEAGRVLMLAYSNRESLALSFRRKWMHYFSRSRRGLWLKGETSGHYQELLRARADCDADAVLVTVRPQGPACHRGGQTCFGRRPFVWKELYNIVEKRIREHPPDSYTAGLDDLCLAGKIREEAEELVEAQTAEEIVWEAADLLYFMTVRLARKGIRLEQVLGELERRRKP